MQPVLRCHSRLPGDGEFMRLGYAPLSHAVRFLWLRAGPCCSRVGFGWVEPASPVGNPLPGGRTRRTFCCYLRERSTPELLRDKRYGKWIQTSRNNSGPCRFLLLSGTGPGRGPGPPDKRRARRTSGRSDRRQLVPDRELLAAVGDARLELAEGAHGRQRARRPLGADQARPGRHLRRAHEDVTWSASRNVA